jgi:hypothetical protein
VSGPAVWLTDPLERSREVPLRLEEEYLVARAGIAEEPGFYTFTLARPPGRAAELKAAEVLERLAVNADARESDLTRLDDAARGKLKELLEAEFLTGSSFADWIQTPEPGAPGRSNLRAPLLWLVLALLLLETWLTGRWIGREQVVREGEFPRARKGASHA